MRGISGSCAMGNPGVNLRGGGGGGNPGVVPGVFKRFPDLFHGQNTVSLVTFFLW